MARRSEEARLLDRLDRYNRHGAGLDPEEADLDPEEDGLDPEEG